MRRTDEAFKNELFRRYGQYKKNRRNLRMLAAAPCVVSAALVCALVVFPRVNAWIDAGTGIATGNNPVGAQPSQTSAYASQDNQIPETPIDLSPDHPFYDLLDELEYTDVHLVRLGRLEFSSDRELVGEASEPLMTQLKRVLQTVEYGDDAEGYTFDYQFDGWSYKIVVEGSPLPRIPDGAAPDVITSHKFELSAGGEFIREEGGEKWYKTDPDAATALVNLIDDSFAPADTFLPSITEEEMQALVEAGGTFHDLIDLIGEPHTSITSGLYTPAWYLADGRMLIVQIELNQMSTPIPIDGYTFWESPMQGILEMLEYCTICNITVTEGVQDNAVFYRSYTNQRNIEAIRELIYDCTQLRVMGSPTEVDPATIDPLQGTSLVIQLNGEPNPGEYVIASYIVTLLDASNGLFFGYDDLNDSEAETQWFKISPETFNALWEYVETHDEDVIGIVPENPFNEVYDLIDSAKIETIEVFNHFDTVALTGDSLDPVFSLLMKAMRNVQGVLPDAGELGGMSYEIRLFPTPETLSFYFAHGCCLSADGAVWYEIDERVANALDDALYRALYGNPDPPDEPETQDNPFRDLIDLLYAYEIKTVTVTGANATSVYMGWDRTRIIAALQNAMESVYRKIALPDVDVSDGEIYTIQLTPSEPDEAFNYRTFELFGNCLRAPDGGIEEWYLIDESTAQTLLDSFRTDDPLDRMLLDSCTLTSVKAICAQTGEELTVTERDRLDKIADLLLQINETALTPDYQTLEWLRTIDADPSSVADDASPLYAVTLHTNKDYLFYLLGDFLFTDGSWWAIDHALTLESLIGGRTYTPPEGNPIKMVLSEIEITSVQVMTTPDEMIANMGYELLDTRHPEYIGALKDGLFGLTLTECEPQAGIESYDLMIVIGHSGILDPTTDAVDDTIDISLCKGYLHFDVTSDESHWYEISELDAAGLMTLAEKIRADME